MKEHFFVTGAMGCIGAWVVRDLVQDGAEVTAFDLATDTHRLKLIMSEEELGRVNFIKGDITDTAAVEEAVQPATHIIHLAALQVPFCKANPVLGARVNVVGTVNVFEAAKKAGLKNVVYASSIAVFGGSEEYEDGPLPDHAALNPRTHYGVYKQANEGTARIYWQDDEIGSIGLRPYTVYGPGRDQGMTSAPTKAMLAAAAGQGFHIPFGGRCAYQYTDDTARIFIDAARADIKGAEVANLRGVAAHMSEIVAAIEAVEPNIAGKITFSDNPLPFPEEADDSNLVVLIGEPHYTDLQRGVDQTVEMFKVALADGRVNVEVLQS
ncbi:MAG: SDR family NAD(P)-dependent oxidoreductase [Chloroflexi bacterium]|nr:SDR family NAD(P)-dependent oxidoreductase [Chloroflexota bacterium]